MAPRISFPAFFGRSGRTTDSASGSARRRTLACFSLCHVGLVGLVSLAMAGCGARATGPDTGTETHWLLACDTDAECGGPTSCLCGVCTVRCENDSVCPGQAPSCTVASGSECTGSSAAAVCADVELVDRLRENTTVELLPPIQTLSSKAVPRTNACDDQGWCWDHPSAPGEEFYAVSADGRYAVGQGGVVFDTAGVYLPRPTGAGALTAVLTLGESLWVGGAGGVWAYEDGAWTRETNADVIALAADGAGLVWALGDRTLYRRDDGEWLPIPIPAGRDAELLRVYDLALAKDGSVWILGGYLGGRFEEGTLFVYEDGNWQEYPAGEQTGVAYFLEGRDGPLVYTALSAHGDPTRIFDARDDWRVLASGGTEPVYSLFWGPDGQLWQSTDRGLAVFGEAVETPSQVLDGDVCRAVAAWDNDRVLCTLYAGGLVWLSNDGSELTAWPEVATPEPYPAGTFSALPPSVYAQRSEAWGTSSSDVWRAPLEHFDGTAWRSLLAEGDDFTAIEIEGTATDDVWFLGETELRRWDGTEVAPVPLPVTPGSDLLALKVLGPSDVWVLSMLPGTPNVVELTHLAGTTWQVSHQMETTDRLAARSVHGANPAAGALAGTSIDLWAVFGQTILRFDGRWWDTARHFDNPEPDGPPSEHLLDVAVDGNEVWILTRRQVLQWQDEDFVVRGTFARNFEYLALTDRYVYNFSDAYSRRLAR